jgi:hypothetical protein
MKPGAWRPASPFLDKLHPHLYTAATMKNNAPQIMMEMMGMRRSVTARALVRWK